MSSKQLEAARRHLGVARMTGPELHAFLKSSSDAEEKRERIRLVAAVRNQAPVTRQRLLVEQVLLGCPHIHHSRYTAKLSSILSSILSRSVTEEAAEKLLRSY